jgi:hypothetical protein
MRATGLFLSYDPYWASAESFAHIHVADFKLLKVMKFLWLDVRLLWSGKQSVVSFTIFAYFQDNTARGIDAPARRKPLT